MLERIASTCRVIASDARLLILHQLSEVHELAANELAQRTGLAFPFLSNLAKDLAGSELVQRRRSGARVYYRLPPEPQSSEGFAPIGLLRRALRDTGWATQGWDEAAPLHLSPDVAGRLPAEVASVLDVVYDAATAFTNVRRLQIVRAMRMAGVCTAIEMETGLRMSAAACRRHMDKLVRRRYAKAEGRGLWRLSPEGRTPLHAEWMGWVLASLVGE